MSTPFSSSAQQAAALINQAYSHLQNRRWDQAEQLLNQLLSRWPESADGIHLYALLRAAQGRHPDAQALYEKALALEPRQAEEILVNLGNSLRAMGRGTEAVNAYRKAIDTNRDFLPAHMNLAAALHAGGDLAGAEAAYRALLKLKPKLAEAHQGLGTVLKDAGRPGDAEAVERAGLALNPANPNLRAALEHNIGVSIGMQKRTDEALKHFERARTLAPHLSIVDYSRANALQGAGRFEEALASYRKAIASNPLDINAHRDFNQLLYRMNRDDEFLKSYDAAAQRAPNAAALPLTKAQTLLHAGREAEALEAFERARAIEPGNAAVLDGLGIAAGRLKDFGRAVAAHEQVIAQAPADVNAWVNFATTLLQAGDAPRALQMAQEAVARSPRDQGALAVLSIALRTLGDERDEALMRYDDFIQVFDLEPPDGYSDMATFNAELDAYLNSLHTDKREHFDQTLRGGTQTRDRLFGEKHDLVERLRARIEGAVGDYVQRMKADESHPLLGRKRDGFRFATSWSSRLRDCGFHTNHIHGKGWISSCYYIALPDAVADIEGKQGWIKFGEPAFAAGLKDPIRKAIQPKAGRLVLFPSYMWHGTVPFRSQQDRTTIAFDAVPTP
jgi:tetratricopeptide (TPR) repeat protein